MIRIYFCFIFFFHQQHGHLAPVCHSVCAGGLDLGGELTDGDRHVAALDHGGEGRDADAEEVVAAAGDQIDVAELVLVDDDDVARRRFQHRRQDLLQRP